MAYDQKLAERVRQALDPRLHWDERKMFGGLGYMLNGHMAFGIMQDRLIVRVGKEHYEAFLTWPHVGTFDKTGRPMRGWVTVSMEGLQKEGDLRGWLEIGRQCVLKLPAK